MLRDRRVRQLLEEILHLCGHTRADECLLRSFDRGCMSRMVNQHVSNRGEHLLGGRAEPTLDPCDTDARVQEHSRIAGDLYELAQ